MPQYHFPTKEERQALIREMQALQGGENQKLSASKEFVAYNQALQDLDRMMSEYSSPGENGIPKELSEEDSERLQQSIVTTAQAGETFLAAAAGQYGAKLTAGLPGVVNKLQNVLSRDYDALSSYEPAAPRSLPELQQDAQTITIDLQDRKTGTMGNLTSSRLPMTIVNAQGKKRTGVFTKAAKIDLKERYTKIIEDAKAQCDDQGKAELDKIFENYRKKLTGKRKTPDGTRVGKDHPDALILGFFTNDLHNKTLTPEQKQAFGFVETELKEKTLKEFLKGLNIDTTKISSAAMKKLTAGLGEYSNSPTPYIQGVDQGFKDGDRLDSRNSAMSKVAGLLGVGSLLARSDNMKVVDEKGKTIEGTFMDFGNGIDLMGNQRAFAAISSQPFDDPDANQTLLKQIADMQVLDFLCFNTDRHPGNLVYQVNEFGKITGIQGIDNDTSFGPRMGDPTDIENLSVISSSMAKKIRDLTPEMLRFSLRGSGLSDDEIENAQMRLNLIQSAIRNKQIEVIPDKEFRNRTIESCKPKKEGRSNVFTALSTVIPRKIQTMREYYGRQDLQEFLGKPEFTNISTTDRSFTVGGIRDSVLEVNRLVKNDETGEKMSDLVTIRGRSDNFKKLMDSVEATAKLQQSEMEMKDEKGRRLVDDYVHLNEAPAWSIMKKVNPAFDDMEEKALTYLAGKMKERKVKSLEDLTGKNDYEQSHIDFAKKVLKTVQNFRDRSAEPKSEAEKEKMRARDDRQFIEDMRNARNEDRKFQEQKKQEQKKKEQEDPVMGI